MPVPFLTVLPSILSFLGGNQASQDQQQQQQQQQLAYQQQQQQLAIQQANTNPFGSSNVALIVGAIGFAVLIYFVLKK